MKILRNKRGSAVLEFALVLPILLLILFGITEFGRAIMTTNVLNSAAREGARLAAVSELGDSLAVRARVEEVLNAANITPTSVNITYTEATRTIRVSVTSDFEVLSGSIIPTFSGTISLGGATVMKYEL